MNQDAGEWKPGDRVWLLPDSCKREVSEKMPAVVVTTLPSGRVRVTYVEQRCLLSKTVEPKRIAHRDAPCKELKEKA